MGPPGQAGGNLTDSEIGDKAFSLQWGLPAKPGVMCQALAIDAGVRASLGPPGQAGGNDDVEGYVMTVDGLLQWGLPAKPGAMQDVLHVRL